MRKAFFLLALLALGAGAWAERAVSFRLSLPPAGLGLGLEAPLERNTALRVYGDLFPSGPSFLVAGDFLFKPDLGQVDRDLRGIRPYFGGGLGVWIPGGNPEVGLGLSLGVEFLLDPRTGLFLDGEYFYAFGGGRFGRTVIGVNLR
uniref:Outer membrane protein beta-barrel domain-containing protein n=1 Tax=Thermus islandicus TaxID=540988 RepID=A0A7C2C0N7_9DEIN